MKGQRQEKKLLYFEGLRGIAAFIVVIYHLIYGFYPTLLYPSGNKILNTISGSPLNIFYNGHFAVYIFFVLSGYVLTFKFFRFKDYKTITSSAIRRYFRLLAPVLFSIFVAYLLLRLNLFFNDDASKITTCCLGTYFNFNPNFLDMLYNSFIRTFFIGQTEYNIVLWTIRYELFGSFLVFSLAALFSKVKSRFLFYFVFLLLTINTVYCAFVAGMILSDMSNSNYEFLNGFRKLIIVPILLIGLFLGSFPNNRILADTVYVFMETSLITDNAHLYHLLGASFLIFAILISEKLKVLLSYRIFLFLGKISFSMYVIHFIIINSFSSFLFIYMIKVLPYNITFVTTSLLSIFVILTSSHFVYKYIDLNGIKLSRYIYEKLR